MRVCVRVCVRACMSLSLRSGHGGWARVAGAGHRVLLALLCSLMLCTAHRSIAWLRLDWAADPTRDRGLTGASCDGPVADGECRRGGDTANIGDGRRTQQTEQASAGRRAMGNGRSFLSLSLLDPSRGRARRASKAKRRGGSAEEAKGRGTQGGVPGISPWMKGWDPRCNHRRIRRSPARPARE